MIQRRTPLRRTPLKRSTKPIRRVSKRRRAERTDYTAVRMEHFHLHPLCQLTIAKHRLVEAQVLRLFALEGGGCGIHEGEPAWYYGAGPHGDIWIPMATQIHHRNKCNGARLTDVRWFASTGEEMHTWVEDHKDQARAEGYLLPIEADPDGRLPNDSQCLTTDEWLAVRAKQD